ncbi:ras-related protein Rab-23-like protein [Cricetulus griseus]|nr:ras-related protein Rab-23-like protein [Cricetulus griseus]
MKSTIELSDFQMYINVFHFVWNKFISSFRVNDEDVRLMLWDTAGQEEFDAITKAYYREVRKFLQHQKCSSRVKMNPEEVTM